MKKASGKNSLFPASLFIVAQVQQSIATLVINRPAAELRGID